MEKNISLFLTAAITYLTMYTANAGTADIGFDFRLRQDDLRWNIGATQQQESIPNILSELSWSNISIAQISAYNRYYFSNNGYIEANINFGEVFNGKVQDSDYFGDNRSEEFSRSHADATGGRVFDANIAFGYIFKKQNTSKKNTLLVIPMLGYGSSQQYFRMKNGVQVIATEDITPPLGSFPGLHSKYNTEWSGPFAAIRVEYNIYQQYGFYARYAYHKNDYEGKGRWNLRNDLKQNPSFKHSADASGNVYTVGIHFPGRKPWTIRLEAEIQRWRTGTGKDDVFTKDGRLGMQLNEVSWNSWSIMFTPTYSF